MDLSRIESRPLRTVFGNYRFHADLIGHIDDQPVAEALRALWLRAEEVVFVGSWPSAVATSTPQLDLARLKEADEWVAKARTGQ